MNKKALKFEPSQLMEASQTKPNLPDLLGKPNLGRTFGDSIIPR